MKANVLRKHRNITVFKTADENQIKALEATGLVVLYCRVNSDLSHFAQQVNWLTVLNRAVRYALEGKLVAIIGSEVDASLLDINEKALTDHIEVELLPQNWFEEVELHRADVA